MNRILLKFLISLWKVILLFPRTIQKKFGLLLGYLFYKSNLKRNDLVKKILIYAFQILMRLKKRKSINQIFYYQAQYHLIQVWHGFGQIKELIKELNIK
jgi:lauroyl/myristoyl acyltransferase